MNKQEDKRMAEKTVLGGGVIALIIWWLLRAKPAEAEPGVNGAILDFGIVPAVGAVGDIVTANVYWQNTGTVDSFFDVLIELEPDLWVVLYRTPVLEAGQTVTTSWQLVVPDVPEGMYNATVKLQKWGYVYDQIYLVDMFQVTGVAGEQADIEGFFISGG